MGQTEWLEKSAQKRVEAAIKRAEEKTAAEFVVTVRAKSGHYRAADLLFGSLVAFAGLLVYVYHPTEFTDDLVPPALALLFAASAGFCSQLGALRRLLTKKRVLQENVRRAAIAEFYDQRISVTRDRTGVLIYVSLMEQLVEVIPDVGIDVRRLGDDGASAIAELRSAVRHGGVDALVQGLGSLSDALGRALPRAEDDVNELPDGVVS
jgi:putative membrane protein